jgi:hypothetical protein
MMATSDFLQACAQAKRPLAWASGLAAAFGLWACSAPDPGPAWFPLRTGDEQRYEVSYSPDAERPAETWTLRTTGPATWQGQTLMQRQHSAGVVFWLLADAQGVRRLAHQTELDREPVADERPQWVLKAPYTVGTEWSSTTVPFLLMRKNEHPRDFKRSHPVQMNWRIVSVTETLQLASGRTLSPCMHVLGQAFVTLYTDPVQGFKEVPLTSHEWYCQGQGLVKFSREEKVASGFMTGGNLTAEWAP